MFTFQCNFNLTFLAFHFTDPQKRRHSFNSHVCLKHTYTYMYVYIQLKRQHPLFVCLFVLLCFVYVCTSVSACVLFLSPSEDSRVNTEVGTRPEKAHLLTTPLRPQGGSRAEPRMGKLWWGCCREGGRPRSTFYAEDIIPPWHTHHRFLLYLTIPHAPSGSAKNWLKAQSAILVKSCWYLTSTDNQMTPPPSRAPEATCCMVPPGPHCFFPFTEPGLCTNTWDFYS